MPARDAHARAFSTDGISAEEAEFTVPLSASGDAAVAAASVGAEGPASGIDTTEATGELAMCFEGSLTDDQIQQILQLSSQIAGRPVSLKRKWTGCTCIVLEPMPLDLIESRFLAPARHRAAHPELIGFFAF